MAYEQPMLSGDNIIENEVHLTTDRKPKECIQKRVLFPCNLMLKQGLLILININSFQYGFLVCPSAGVRRDWPALTDNPQCYRIKPNPGHPSFFNTKCLNLAMGVTTE